MHRCPKRDCDTDVPDAMFACYPHWQELPRHVRLAIGRTSALSLLTVARQRAIAAAREAWDNAA